MVKKRVVLNGEIQKPSRMKEIKKASQKMRRFFDANTGNVGLYLENLQLLLYNILSIVPKNKINREELIYEFTQKMYGRIHWHLCACVLCLRNCRSRWLLR